MVAAYLDSPEALNEKPKGLEVGLSERLPGLSVSLTGAMDLVRSNLVPVDFKSAAAEPDARPAAFDHEIQLVSYQLLIEAATGESPPSLELVFLWGSESPLEHFSFTENDLRSFSAPLFCALEGRRCMNGALIFRQPGWVL